MVYNAVLRRAPVELYEVFENSGNKFSTTIHVLQSAVVKIARNFKIPDGLVLYRGLSMQFPPNFFKVDENGCRGFAEWGFMSTTANRDIAVMYSGVREGKPTATVLQIKTSAVNRAACIEMFSQYSQEREYLWVPLSYLQPEGGQIVESSPHGVLQTINVMVSVNGTAATTEDLLGKKKQLHIKGFETLLDDLNSDLQSLIEQKHENYHTRAKELTSEILKNAGAVLQRHKEMEAAEYTNASVFRGLNEDMLEVFKFGHSKLKYWLEGGAFLKTVTEYPLRTCHRLFVVRRRKELTGMTGSELEDAARDLCRLTGLVRMSIEETNEIGETRLIQAAADDESLSILQLLIQSRANVNAVTPEGHTAAIRAAQYGHLGCLQLLMEARADIDMAHVNGGTALYLAASNGHTSCLRKLIDAKARVEVADLNGTTPLFLANQFGHSECVELLVQAGANVNRTPSNGATPIYVAAANDHVECLRLLKAAGADINARFKGKTPLDIAREKTNIDCVEELEASAADRPVP